MFQFILQVYVCILFGIFTLVYDEDMAAEHGEHTQVENVPHEQLPGVHLNNLVFTSPRDHMLEHLSLSFIFFSNNNSPTRLITMRSQPNYIQVVLLW